MIRSSLAVLCEGVSIDVSTGQATIYSLIEAIPAPTYPAFFQSIFFLAVLERDPADPRMPEARFGVSLGGAPVLGSPVVVDFQDQLRTRTSIRINGMLVTGPGVLKFSLSIDGAEVAVREIQAEIITATVTQRAPVTA
jgi:hypothetical protein